MRGNYYFQPFQRALSLILSFFEDQQSCYRSDRKDIVEGG